MISPEDYLLKGSSAKNNIASGIRSNHHAENSIIRFYLMRVRLRRVHVIMCGVFMLGVFMGVNVVKRKITV